MQDLIILPTFDRPEMLWVCLDYIAASPDHQIPIRVYVDAHLNQAHPPKPEIDEVLTQFPQLNIQVGYRRPHSYQGNSFNLLMAYRDAYESLAEHVFLIEDDVLIHPEFFAWHRRQHQEQVLGCSIGVKKEPQHGPYASLGVCFRREFLKIIMPHCREAYFQDMRGYIRRNFEPANRLLRVLDYEQDGLWSRILLKHKVVWSPTSLAQHVGWYGYHRRKSIRPKGTLVQRRQQITEVLSDSKILKAWVKDFYDIKPLQLIAGEEVR